MAERAKLFRSGGSQAVRLPKEFRFEGRTEVLISRVGGKVVLEEPPRGWTPEFLALAGAAPDFPRRPRRRRAEAGPGLD